MGRIRAQLRFDRRTVCVRSRPRRDCTHEFPELSRSPAALACASVILDGELVCFGADGEPDFAALRTRLAVRSARAPAVAQRCSPATLVAFDGIWEAVGCASCPTHVAVSSSPSFS